MRRVKLKTDRYRKARDGRTRLLAVFCSHCGHLLLTYQKDGMGRLLRCYLDRILAPRALSSLSRDPRVRRSEDMPRLKCAECGCLIGAPMRHASGRLAFRLRRTAFTSRLLKRVGKRKELREGELQRRNLLGAKTR